MKLFKIAIYGKFSKVLLYDIYIFKNRFCQFTEMLRIL